MREKEKEKEKVSERKLRDLIENADLDEIFYLLQNGIIHVRDCRRAVNKIERELYKSFCSKEIDIYEYDRALKAINATMRRIEQEYHDFTINNKTLTLPSDEFLYYASYEEAIVRKRFNY